VSELRARAERVDRRRAYPEDPSRLPHREKPT
jgi:hypothetical protein